ncbi:uncharacterized protein BP01DRAFT_379157 [Aspergillus saccharolyticus JOP 1030-1]|uniref:Secreted protein n=1 Tax=Aspergillus saccharolyticus JOP 1030-1 TaxID=1450539 RepID=A0A318ZMA4_9EURO|nr:hypothetical protein BP01DRAFT_379157 [Aspergillus saccharolyticus JOP 1030-1]PYH48751.1 hypothetical protein BP01DRAFT_379157 [Aspergillus saccharolyticus JOP 1030-1]
MKNTLAVWSLILSLLCHITTAFPSFKGSTLNPSTAWQILLYQNKRCTGQTTSFSGNTSLPCHDAILNGGALGYIVQIANGTNCSVQLFSDPKCKQTSNTTLTLNSTASTCQVMRIQEQDMEIRRFSVICRADNRTRLQSHDRV